MREGGRVGRKGREIGEGEREREGRMEEREGGNEGSRMKEGRRVRMVREGVR